MRPRRFRDRVQLSFCIQSADYFYFTCRSLLPSRIVGLSVCFLLNPLTEGCLRSYFLMRQRPNVSPAGRFIAKSREIGGSSKEAVEAASLRKPDWPIVNVENCENEVEMTKKKTKDPSTYFMITCTSKIILDAIVDASGKVVGVMTSCCVFAFQDDASTFATNPKRSVMTAEENGRKQPDITRFYHPHAIS